MDIFAQANREKLRFEITDLGVCTCEDLWDAIKPSSRAKNSRAILEDYEVQLEQTVESYGKSSRRSTSDKRTKEQKLNVLRLEIVRFILDTFYAETAAAQEEAAIKEHNQAIMDELLRRQRDFSQVSDEELRARLR